MIIYKKDTKGKIRTLEIITEGGTLFQISGLLDGAKVTNSKECKGKNIGKSNETTPEEQAIKQAESKILQKFDQGYFKTKEDAETKTVILPMLAKGYKEQCNKIDWKRPVFVQPKLNGMRCLGMKDDFLLSRKGKRIITLDHLYDELGHLRELITIPDGELYAHGLSFQENMRLIKKYRPGKTEKIKFHIYDNVLDLDFEQRHKMIAHAFRSKKFNNFSLVETYLIHNESELKRYHKLFLSLGYEGTIVRHGPEGYAINGRSANLLKYKDFKDTVARVIDVVPSEARPEQGVLVCEGGFRAGLKFSHKEREEILQNKQNYIGQMAEIRYFEETEDGKPWFPVCVGFRLDK